MPAEHQEESAPHPINEAIAALCREHGGMVIGCLAIDEGDGLRTYAVAPNDKGDRERFSNCYPAVLFHLLTIGFALDPGKVMEIVKEAMASSIPIALRDTGAKAKDEAK